MIRVRDPFRRSQLAIAALFCFLGFQYGTWASRVPALKARLDLTPAEVGLMLLATGVGAVLSFSLVARLMTQLGSRRLAAVSALGLVLILAALSVAPSYPVAIVVLFLDGVAVACLNVAMNAQAAALEAKYQRNTMAKLHAVFSGGIFGAALVASAVTSLTSGLAVHFGVAAIILLLLVFTAWSGMPIEDETPEQAEPVAAAETAGASADGARRRWRLPARMTLLLGLAMVFGEMVEGAMNDWTALYLRDVTHAAEELTPLGIAVVSGMMVLARLFADGWRTRWGNKQVVVVGAALAGCGLTAAVVLGGLAPALIGFAFVGLGMAAVTPIIYVCAARQGSDALTFVATMGTVGLLAGPPVIGFIAEASSLVWGMGTVAAFAFLVSLSLVRWPRDAFEAEEKTTRVDEGSPAVPEGVA